MTELKGELVMKTNMYAVTYKGVTYMITKQEYEELMSGYRTWHDMFD